MKTREDAAEALLALGWRFADIERVLKTREQMAPAIYLPPTNKEKLPPRR